MPFSAFLGEVLQNLKEYKESYKIPKRQNISGLWYEFKRDLHELIVPRVENCKTDRRKRSQNVNRVIKSTEGLHFCRQFTIAVRYFH